MRRGVVFVLVGLAACRSPTPPGPTSGTPEAGASTEQARVPTSRSRVVLTAARACVVASDRMRCGAPMRIPASGDAGTSWEAAMVLVAGPVPDEASPRVDCTRDGDLARCEGHVASRGIASVAAAPYLLGKDGSVLVAEGIEQAPTREDELRKAFVAKLPRTNQLARTEYGACAVDEGGALRCWLEPALPFHADVVVPKEPSVITPPGGTDVADVAMEPFLHVCVRTRTGAVRCAPPADVDLCVLSATSSVQCGASSLRTGQPTLLSERTPQSVLARALDVVSGLDGHDPVKSFALYRTSRASQLESHRRLFVDGGAEGGCARLASGVVRCWERCAPAQKSAPSAWTTFDVEGAPPEGRVVLGAHDGYAITREGALYTWRRPAEPRAACGSPLRASAERLDLGAPVERLETGVMRDARRPQLVGVDCALLRDGRPACFATEPSGRAPLTLRDAEDDAGSR